MEPSQHDLPTTFLRSSPCQGGPVDYPECAKVVRQLELQIVRIAMWQEQIAEGLTRVRRILDGNGVEGLKTRIARLEDHDVATRRTKSAMLKALVAAWLAFVANILFYFMFSQA